MTTVVVQSGPAERERAGLLDWLTTTKQEMLESLTIPNGTELTGMEARETAGYGLINLRLHSND